MLLFKSFTLLQQEKLMVIKKELEHLYHIADFYQGTGTNDKYTSTQRDKIAKTLSEDIEHHAKYIQYLNKEVQDNYDSNKDSILHFLTFYDLYNTEIESVLKVVKTIQSKLSQFLQDRFNQYLPIPMTTKRYSSKGFLDYLDTYYKKILGKQGIDKIPMIFWGHVSGFTASQSIKISSSTESTSHTHYIETAYWNYEIPFLLPIITHELGHIALENKDSALSKIQEYLSELLHKSDIFPYPNDEEFLKELASDIFAYTIHGFPYLIVLCHELLGENFSNQFSNELMDDISIFPIADLNDNIELYISLIRIKTLLGFIELYDSEYAYEKLEKNPSASQTIIKEINNILDFLILPIDHTQKTYDEQIRDQLDLLSINKEDKHHKESLAELYTLSYPGLTQDYINFHAKISSIPDLLFKSKYFDERLSEKIRAKLVEIQGEDKNDILKFKKIFIELTQTRFDNIKTSQSKNNFRQLLLEQDDKGQPYELTLYKTRTDSSKSCFINLKKEIERLQSNNPAYLTQNLYFTFGFFTALSLTEKKESLTEGDIKKVLESGIDNKTTPFYQYKYSLIKLWDNIGKDDDRYEDNGIHMILQLQLKDNTTDSTNEALKQLIYSFKNKHNKHKIEIFKALGPKEIIIKCHSTSISNIHEARQSLLHDNPSLFRRSYTIVYGDYETIKKDTFQNIMTIIRKKSTKTIEEIKACGAAQIEKFYYTSGVTDIQIHWKIDTTMEFIFNCYDTWTKAKYTTDIQTHIIETI